MRLIDADKLEQELIELRTMAEYKEGVNSYAYATLKYAVVCVINAPPIEAEPVRHGEWILKYIGAGHVWKCSCCHKQPCIYITKDTKYCPNCGARMDGGHS